MKYLSTILSSVLLSLGIAAVSPANAEVRMRYGHPNPVDSIGGKYALRFAELVKDKTGGEVVVDVFPSSQLGTARERFEGVQFGLIDFGHDSFSTVGQALPEIGALDLPYLYRDVEHAVRATTPETSAVMSDLNQKLVSGSQIEILGSFLYGIRELTTRDFPVRTPEDLAGKKIRAIPVPVWIAMVEGMNAIPTPVDFAELTSALATGVVDGQENPLTAILTSSMYETQKYLMLTDHMINIIPLFASTQAMAKLTAGQQEAVRSAAREAGVDILAISLAEHEALQGELASRGMTIITEAEGLDKATFRQRVYDHVVGKFPEWSGIIEGIQAIE